MSMIRTGRVPRRAGNQPAAAGFTLVELMVVVAIVGVLLAIAIPAFTKSRMSAQNGCYIADARTAKNAFMQHCLEQGKYPPDVTPGIVPAGMAPYLGRFPWTGVNSIGGRWDWDYQQFGCVAGVSVYQPTVSQQQMQQIDKIIDDGDLATGGFRERRAVFISIIE
jgi:prepilin-type N-terminal cleavage/methylation domain-containing protein